MAIPLTKMGERKEAITAAEHSRITQTIHNSLPGCRISEDVKKTFREGDYARFDVRCRQCHYRQVREIESGLPIGIELVDHCFQVDSDYTTAGLDQTILLTLEFQKVDLTLARESCCERAWGWGLVIAGLAMALLAYLNQ